MKQKWKMKVALGCIHVSQAWGEMYHRKIRLFPHMFICTICLLVVLNTKDYLFREHRYIYVLMDMHPWLVRCDQNTDPANCRLLFDVEFVLLHGKFTYHEWGVHIYDYFWGALWKNIWNIAESNFGSDGGGINLHAEWPCNFHDSILSLTLQLIKWTKMGALNSSKNREYALHVNINCSILSTKIILFMVEHVFLHYKP